MECWQERAFDGPASPAGPRFAPSPRTMLTHDVGVMRSESEASAFPAGYGKTDSSPAAQNDILTKFDEVKALL